MTYELIPPTEDFFSHQWYERDGFGMKMMTDDLYSRIDSTRKKLIALEAKLQQKLQEDGYNHDLHAFWDRISWLRSYVGVWTSNDPTYIWSASMLYPQSKMVMTEWDETVLGKRKGTDESFLVLLSPSSVDWLNRVEKWVSSDTTIASTTL